MEALLKLHDDVIVYSFRENPEEPPFMDAIAKLAGWRFVESKRPQDPGDLLIAVGWRYLVPQAVYSQASLGAYVFHDSLLPKRRGFAPTVWSMIEGDTETGATLFRMVEEVDAGDIVCQHPVSIGPEDMIQDVMGRVTQAYISILESCWPALSTGIIRAIPQDHSKATFCKKRRWPEDYQVDPSWSKEQIDRFVRATAFPYPGAWMNGRRVYGSVPRDRVHGF